MRTMEYRTEVYDFLELGNLPEKGVLWVTPNRRWCCHACPEDGCEKFVTLPIGESHQNPWRTSFDGNGTLTLSPSILNHHEPTCSAHYFLEHGKVRWC